MPITYLSDRADIMDARLADPLVSQAQHAMTLRDRQKLSTGGVSHQAAREDPGRGAGTAMTGHSIRCKRNGQGGRGRAGLGLGGGFQMGMAKTVNAA